MTRIISEKNQKMKILVACEFSGIVREAFRKKGHEAWSCDILPTEIPGNHIKDDVLNHLNEGWDMMIAHPPCTFLCNSGVRWLHSDLNRWCKLQTAKDFFKIFLESDITKICIENPIPHKYAELPKYTQLIQPYEYGHLERKATCLWLKNLPKLVPTNNTFKQMKLLPKNQQQRIHYIAKSPQRSKLRSITFQGIAEAMANQWG